MVRSSRWLVFLSAISLFACGGEAVDGPVGLTVTVPATSEAVVPFDLAVVRGRAAAKDVLKLRVTRGGGAYAFDAAGRAGSTLAFSIEPPGSAAGRARVDLPGLPTAPSGTTCVAAVRGRLADLDVGATLREGLDEDAFLVDLPASPGADALARTLDAVTGGVDLRFLIEVLPKTHYRPAFDGSTPPRLEAEPYPWPDTENAFLRYKEDEVSRWRKAAETGLPYVPSREGFLVLPRHGTEAASVNDFLVFEWPAEAEHRFDGRTLRNAIQSRDPATGKPVVLYDIAEDRRNAFEAWTGANVGLPMAIVLDWEVRSAPVIHSPLRDNVQITLGQGSWPELLAEAKRLSGLLAQRSGALPVTLDAVLTRWDDGAFEVLVPLAEAETVTIALAGVVAGQTATREIHYQPLVDVAEPYAVDAVLADLVLGRLDTEAGAVRLRGLGTAAEARLAAVLASDPSLARRVSAARLLGHLDRESEIALDALIAALSDPLPELRVAAATAAAHLASTPALAPAMVEAMGGLAPVDQVPFVQALARLGPETDGALDALLALAVHGTDDVATAARMALASAAWGAAVLESGIADTEDPVIRAAAVASVGAAVDASTIPWLIARTKDPDGGVRMAATAALIPFAWEGTNEPLEPHLDALCTLLGDPEPAVRHNVARLLGQLGGDAVDRLLALVEDDRREIREAALLALTASETVRADALSVLQDALGDADLRIRLAAVAPYLRHQGKPEDAMVVIEEGLLDTHPDGVPRRTALMILWTTGLEPKTYDSVSALLEDAREEVRVLAALVLVRGGKDDERAAEIVEAVKNDATHPLHGLTLMGR